MGGGGGGMAIASRKPPESLYSIRVNIFIRPSTRANALITPSARVKAPKLREAA